MTGKIPQQSAYNLPSGTLRPVAGRGPVSTGGFPSGDQGPLAHPGAAVWEGSHGWISRCRPVPRPRAPPRTPSTPAPKAAALPLEASTARGARPGARCTQWRDSTHRLGSTSEPGQTSICRAAVDRANSVASMTRTPYKSQKMPCAPHRQPVPKPSHPGDFAVGGTWSRVAHRGRPEPDRPARTVARNNKATRLLTRPG
ncbi:hypothetical protein M8818_005901 [Zalaria obscura]|uniref:Uncharacterized protein n=1 Tax=Zalaria obscura TaxID=2024903 RepID=A0ACC3S866_9PEZI